MKRMKKLLTLLVVLAAMALMPCVQSFAAGGVPGNVKKLTAKADETSVKLSWKKAGNAQGYEIHQVDLTTGLTQKVASTSKTTYTVKGLNVGEKYSFQIFAYNKSGGVKNLSAAGSNVVTVKTKAVKPKVPSNFQISTYGDKSITLKWSKVSNAYGYYIYLYDEETGKYQAIDKTRNTTITIKDLKDGQECKFKIQSYRKVGKTIVTSKMSSAVKGTARKFSKLVKQVHGRYYNTTVTATTKATVSSTGKKITVKKGTKVVATTLSGKTVTAMLPDGTKIKIASNKLKFTSLNTTTREYSKEVKEAFVNQKGYSSSTNYLIWISQYTTNTSVFKGSRGKWKLVRSMPCVIGTMGRTTPGTFKICKRAYDYGGPVIYFSWNSAKNWGNAFHRRVDGNTRGAYSHGCVRLSDSDLSFIANNCPMGTTVISY